MRGSGKIFENFVCFLCIKIFVIFLASMLFRQRRLRIMLRFVSRMQEQYEYAINVRVYAIFGHFGRLSNAGSERSK